MKQRDFYLCGVGIALLASALIAQPPAGAPPQGKGPIPGKGKAKGGPAYRMEKGLPIDTRPPLKTDDHDVFKGQSHAPY